MSNNCLSAREMAKVFIFMEKIVEFFRKERTPEEIIDFNISYKHVMKDIYYGFLSEKIGRENIDAYSDMDSIDFDYSAEVDALTRAMESRL
jgi:hypothetical protein